MIVAVPAQIWLLWLNLLVDVCDGLLVDLTGYRSLIVTLHNRYRAAERAADMKEMVGHFSSLLSLFLAAIGRL